MKLADIPSQAWRLLTRSFMKSVDSPPLLAYSPMIHARLFLETQNFRDRMFHPTRSGLAKPRHDIEDHTSPPYLDGHPGLDRPLFVQFCANDPDVLLEAAQYVEPYCNAVDLNLGCPQGIARKGNYGAFLQEDQDLVYRLINKLHNHLDIPVTAKIRILDTKEKTLQYAKKVLSAGASIITIHGRQREQKGHKTGLADWSVLKYLREQLPAETVIFANGNVLRHDDIQKCLEHTGADAVMSAEGNLYDPTIFATPPATGEEGREYWRGRNGKGGFRMDAVFRRYLDIIYKHVLERPPPVREPLYITSDPTSGLDSAVSPQASDQEPPKKKQKHGDGYERPNIPSLLVMQPHLFHLLRPLVSKHTSIRDTLAKCRGGDVPAFEKVLQMVEAAVREGLLDYQANPSRYDDPEPLSEKARKEAKTSDESSVATVAECKRPWWVCQPYVRPLPKEAVQKGSITISKKEKRRLEEEQTLQKVRTQDGTKSEREILDARNGMPTKELPGQAMVAG